MSERPHRFSIEIEMGSRPEEPEKNRFSKRWAFLYALVLSGLGTQLLYPGGLERLWAVGQHEIERMMNSIENSEGEDEKFAEEFARNLKEELETKGKISADKSLERTLKGESLYPEPEQTLTPEEAQKKVEETFEGVAESMQQAQSVFEQQQILHQATKKIRYSRGVPQITLGMQTKIPSGNCVMKARTFSHVFSDLPQKFQFYTEHVRLLVQLLDGQWYSFEGGNMQVVDISIDDGTVFTEADTYFLGFLADFEQQALKKNNDNDIFSNANLPKEPTAVYKDSGIIEETIEEYMTRQKVDLKDAIDPISSEAIPVGVVYYEDIQNNQHTDPLHDPEEPQIRQLVQDFETKKRKMYFPPGNIYLDYQRDGDLNDTLRYIQAISKSNPDYKIAKERIDSYTREIIDLLKRGKTDYLIAESPILSQHIFPLLGQIPNGSISGFTIEATEDKIRLYEKQFILALKEGGRICATEDFYVKQGDKLIGVKSKNKHK